jgi:hypothetical protein
LNLFHQTFFPTSQKHETKLGLFQFMVKALVKLNGGKEEVEVEPGDSKLKTGN